MPMTSEQIHNKPAVDDRDEALLVLEEYVNDNCCDNFRFAYLDDPYALELYNDAKDNGCCGSIDVTMIVGGHEALVGCNYGH